MCPWGHFAQKWENQINHYEENKPGILTSTSNIYTNEILAPWKSMNSIRDSFQTSNGILHSSKVRHCLKRLTLHTLRLLTNTCSGALWELSRYHHITKNIVWKYYYATISIWSPTNSGVKISVSLKGFRICNNICTPFWGFGSYRPVCLKKAQNLEVFYLSQFWNLNFEISKVSFL